MAYGVIMLYHLHMPSYVLGTFTEYPYLICFEYIVNWTSPEAETPK